ncbi:MAG: molybdenum cofactor guanylyltransferase [Lachnospiraceae bacterium]|nr:molybdenum cofactor guanylyltransferase [Lachnospiraceae bacterium]
MKEADDLAGSFRIAVAVLAGGHSTRMGSPKETKILEGDGRTFLEKICDEVDAARPGVIPGKYLSLREEQEIRRKGYRKVADRYGDIGPLGGIASVLEQAGEDGFHAVLVLACDLIRYDTAELEEICGRYRGEDLLFAEGGGSLQPLASIYGVSLLPAARELIRRGQYRIRLLGEEPARVSVYVSGRPEVYENRNTP